MKIIESAAAAYRATGQDGPLEVAQELSSVDSFSFSPSESSLPTLAFLSQALTASQRASFLGDWDHEELLKLPWSDAPDRVAPDCIVGRTAFCTLVGPEAIRTSNKIRFGFFLQAPGSYYPPHSHAAEEHYLVLSGTARWQKGDGPFVPRRPGSYIFHESYESHAMETEREPVLAFWAWCGNLDRSTFRYDGTA